MQFRTQYDDHDRFFTCHGEKEYTIYTSDENGNPVPSGIGNIYDEIQSHRESVELATLLQRYAQGDETALNKVQGIYEDVVGAPTSMVELFDMVKNAENSFNSLPPSFRQLFNNSAVEFWRQAGTPEFSETVRKFDAEQKKDGTNDNSGFSDKSSDSSCGTGGDLSA